MTCFYCADGSEKRNIFKTSVQTRPSLPLPPRSSGHLFCPERVCDCHEFTSPKSCPAAVPLASACRDGSPARCGSAHVRSHCHQQGDPLSPAQRGPHRRAAAGWGLRSPGRSRSSPAHNHIDHRGSPAGLLGVCSCLGQPETEVVGRPVGQPLGWQVGEGPLEGRTDQGVGVEDRSQNL